MNLFLDNTMDPSSPPTLPISHARAPLIFSILPYKTYNNTLTNMGLINSILSELKEKRS